MSDKLNSNLLAFVDKEQRKRFLQDYKEANFVLDVIQKAIEKKLELLETQEESPELFKDPGYVATYAHLMGQKKMAKNILTLFPNKKGQDQ